MTEEVQVNSSVSFADRMRSGVGLQLTLGAVGVRRKAAKGAVDIKAKSRRRSAENGEEVEEKGKDPSVDSVHLSKDILKCDEIKNIQRLDAEIRGYVAARAIPSMLRRGVYLVPVELVQEIHTQLELYRARRDEMVDEFIRVYPDEREKAKERLGDLYSARDYPTDNEIRKAFYMRVDYVSFDVPEQLGNISSEMYAEQQRIMQERVREAADEVRTVLRTQLAELVDHMVERLHGGNEQGKPKVFRNTLVTNMTEFLNYFEPRNVTDDQDLSALVQRCRNLLSGVDADAIRSSEAIRDRVASGMGEVKEILDTMVRDAPTRKIRPL